MQTDAFDVCRPQSSATAAAQVQPLRSAATGRRRQHANNNNNGTVAGMTPQILDEILTLSDELRISEVDAASLYAGASDVTTRRWLEGRLSRSFVGAAVAAGRANDGDDDYDGSSSSGGGGGGGASVAQPPLGQGYPSWSGANSADAAAGTATASSKRSHIPEDPLSSPRFGDDVLSAARELYFYERSCLLSTLFMIIRARVEAASNLLHGTGDNGATSTSGAGAVLAATDQLLNADLVSNLVASARELTTKITDVGRTIAQGRIARREAKKAATSAPPAPAAPAPPAFGGFGTSGAFGAPAPAPPTAPLTGQGAATATHHDMDHVLLAFAFQSRQTVAECLFYLAYHTQLMGNEVGSMVDLIRDLTNGEGWQQQSGGLGCGLPILDPIRDVPSIYLAGADAGGSRAMPSQFGQSSATSAQLEKGPAAWEGELVSNLWDGAGGSPSSSPSVSPGIPQLLQCTGTLVMAVLCSLDPGQVLMDRKTHQSNVFGSVSSIVE